MLDKPSKFNIIMTDLNNGIVKLRLHFSHVYTLIKSKNGGQKIWDGVVLDN